MITEELNEINRIWKEIRDIINKLFSDGKLHPKDFLALMNNATTVSLSNLFDIVDPCTGLKGAKLYELIQELLKKHLDDLKQRAVECTDEEEIATFVVTEWELYKRTSMILNCACFYLNGNWITRSRECDKLNIYKINRLAYVFWRNIILTDFATSAMNGALKLIKRQRKGNLIDSNVITNLIDCIVLVEPLEGEVSEHPTSYEDRFHGLILEDAEKFYNDEGINYLQSNPVTEYLKKIEQRLAEEQKRLKDIWYKITNDTLMKTCERSLIQRHLPRFEREFIRLLELDKYEDLERMYLLVARNPEDLDRFTKHFYAHVLSEGLTAIQEKYESGSMDAKNYGTVILKVFKKYSHLVSNVFKDNINFMNAFRTACTRFLNESQIVSSEQSVQFLAQYCDVLLRKSNQNMETPKLKDTFTYFMLLYNLHYQKDVFDKHYFRLFVNRSVQNTSAGHDVENLMISTMESHLLDIQYTNELRKMQHELKKSEHLSQELQQINLIDSKESADKFEVKVLSKILWKIKQFPAIRLPDELEVYTAKLINLYAEKEPHKQLKICYNLCHGVVVTNCFKESYTIRANLVQISVLLQYNKSSRWTLSELVKQTQIEMEYLLPSLEVLIERKFLRCSGSEKQLKPNSVISVNEAYTNTKYNINLYTPIKMIKMVPKVNTEIEKSHRREIIQSNIIFVLKKYQVMKHQELIDQVSNRISRFTLNENDFNECIVTLVKKQYLKHSNEEGSYTYLP